MANCPKCNKPSFPAGPFVESPAVNIPLPEKGIKVFFFWIKFPKVSVRFQYCPACGFLAVRDVQVG